MTKHRSQRLLTGSYFRNRVIHARSDIGRLPRWKVASVRLRVGLEADRL